MTAVAETLEREHELDRIAAALDAAAGGAGRTVIIEGPAGIGKTRLVQDARALAKARGFGRLQATGDELESAIAWSVVRQMVERGVMRQRGDARARAMEGPAGAALAAIERASAESASTEAALARTFHALWWVAADLAADRPVLITVDDAQWADAPSLGFLAYLSRRLADLPIALVVGTRPPAVSSGPLVELSAGRSSERVLPRPLTQDAVAAIGACRGAPPDAAVAAAVHAASGGNPLLAGQVLDELQRRDMALDARATASFVRGLGPSTVSRALLARLPADAIALAGAAAVLGSRCDGTRAGRLAGLDEARFAAATDALVAGHVLAGAGAQLTFVHPVVREAVLAELGAGERAALHARAARDLHDAGAPVARVAAHLVAAPTGSLDGAADVLRQAAAQLLAEGDARTAAAHLARALDEAPGDRELQAELGFALLRAGVPREARDHLRASAEAAPTPFERARRLAAVAGVTASLDGAEAAVAELRATLEGMSEPTLDPARLVLEARLASICSLMPGASGEAGQRLQRFAGLSGDTPQERPLLALLAQRARYDGRPAQEVATLVARALGNGAYLEDVADGSDGLIGWVGAVNALVCADGIELARAEVQRARGRVRRHGSPIEFAIVTSAACLLAWRTGDVRATEAEAEAAIASISDEDPSPVVVAVRATATHLGVLAALERDDRDGAARAIAAFDETCSAGPRVVPVMWLRDARAAFALAGQEPETAYREAMTLGEAARAAHLDIPSAPWRIRAIIAAQRLGRSEEAASLAAEHLALARRWGAAGDTGAALRALARVERERRLDLLAEAIDVLEESPARLELGWALVDLGEALRVAGRRRDAHDPLRRSADLAAACGSLVLRGRALEALAALGDRPRKQMFSGEESLTASERRVVSLAVDGRTNRDIAQELFVSPKTVENHLGRVYVKLGITSRRELAGALA